MAEKRLTKDEVSCLDPQTLDVFTIQSLLRQGYTIYDLPLRVVSYSRVSTDEDEQIHSINAQRKYYEDFAKTTAPNWTMVKHFYDEGISGTSTRKRTGFQEMVQFVENAATRPNLIITKEVSRFARNTLDSLAYTRKFTRWNVGVFFQTDNINTLDSDGELRLTIMSSMAQDESRKISSRVKFGINRSIENGVVFGNNRFYGYEKKDGKLVVQPEEAKMVQCIFDLYVNQGYGLRRISRWLYDNGYRTYAGGRFADTTVKRMLENKKYCGWYVGKKSERVSFIDDVVKQFPKDEWLTYKDTHAVPAIIDEETWEKAQILLEQKTAYFNNPDGPETTFFGVYPYSGKIECGIHHVSYCRVAYRNKLKSGESREHEFWQCLERNRGGMKSCSMPTLYREELDDIMRQIIDKLITNHDELVERAMKIIIEVKSKEIDNGSAIADLDKKLFLAQAKKEKLLDLCTSEVITNAEFKTRNNQLNEQIKEWTEQRDLLKADEHEGHELTDQEIAELRKTVEKMLEFAQPSDSDNISDEMIRSVLNKIIVLPGSTKNRVELNVFVNLQGVPAQFVIDRSNRTRTIPSKCYPSQVL